MSLGVAVLWLASLTAAMSTQERHTPDSDDAACEYFNKPDVLNMTFRLPRTKVPANLTTYIRLDFQLPADRAYHFIGAEFLLDNYDLVHHMTLQACNEQGMKTSTAEGGEGYKECGFVMGMYNQGVKVQCLDPAAGIRFGLGSWTTAQLQVHWTNEDRLDTLYDSSGFRVYYTARLRPEDAAVFTVGQQLLDIPPGREDVLHTGICPSSCTNRIFTGPVHVISALNHMHFLGRSEDVTVTRLGHPSIVLTNDSHYSYKAPQVHYFDPPITLLPGDEVKVNCHFRSTGRNSSTGFGRSSYDEMCFVYMTYYPKANVHTRDSPSWQKVCIQSGEPATCLAPED